MNWTNKQDLTRNTNQKQRFKPKQIKVKKTHKTQKFNRKTDQTHNHTKNTIDVLHKLNNTKHKGEQILSNKRHGFVRKPT
jgi:hypothetical protein